MFGHDEVHSISNDRIMHDVPSVSWRRENCPRSALFQRTVVAWSIFVGSSCAHCYEPAHRLLLPNRAPLLFSYSRYPVAPRNSISTALSVLRPIRLTQRPGDPHDWYVIKRWRGPTSGTEPLHIRLHLLLVGPEDVSNADFYSPTTCPY